MAYYESPAALMDEIEGLAGCCLDRLDALIGRTVAQVIASDGEDGSCAERSSWALFECDGGLFWTLDQSCDTTGHG